MVTVIRERLLLPLGELGESGVGRICIKIGTLLQASLSQDMGYLETRAIVRARTKGPNPTLKAVLQSCFVAYLKNSSFQLFD